MRQAAANTSAYMERTKCVCIMPFGNPVVPLVYMMLKRSSVATSAGSRDSEASEASAAYSSSMASKRTRQAAAAGATATASERCETRIFASESRKRLSSPEAVSSGESGTSTAPIEGTAQYTSSSSQQLPSTVATLS